MPVSCKHHQYDSLGFCPICEHSRAMASVKKKLEKEDFFGSSPTVFVGRYGYPNVNVGIMAPPEIDENAWLLDAPRYWGSHGFTIPQMIDIRSELINSRFSANIKGRNRLLEIGKEITMASKPVELEINLEKKPSFRMSFHDMSAPSGPKAPVKNVEITSNPRIDRKVDYVVSDIDFKANSAINYLYEHGYDENFITRLLSIGNLGVEADRKLVPTRWSITATDDSIGRQLIKKVKDFPEADYLAFFGGYLGNYYLVLLFPEVWSYELFEMAVPGPGERLSFGTDYEPYGGRKEYAFATAGGYYAARLPILQRLLEMKRQAGVLCLRFITKEYAVPLGVWVVREATRKSMGSRPIEFSGRELMLAYAKDFAKRKFGCDISGLLKESRLLRKIKSQRRLDEYRLKS
jgi:hypothetical protein